MLPTYGLEFVEVIEPTRSNAEAIQRLGLQDALAAGFANPYSVANPYDTDVVALQMGKLIAYPERYSGFAKDGELVAYTKQWHWFTGDERPFATGFHALKCHARHLVHRHRPTGEWGIFGLVASNELGVRQRRAALTNLLRYSFGSVENGERTVNVVLHDYDPLLEIAEDYGFVRRGRKAEAAGAPGLKQWRYKRLATA